jgi:uracil-DNA glycosylase
MANAASPQSSPDLLKRHVRALLACRKCPRMIPPPVSGGAIWSRVMLIGQAPGTREPLLGRPFAWTAGRTLFRWIHHAAGFDEETARATIYFAAVCRCFPGKNPHGGDRVPAPDEIANCAPWMEREFELLQPRLIIPVGRLAITRLLGPLPMEEAVGRVHRVRAAGRLTDAIPLPHPSGASAWPHIEPGKRLLAEALELLGHHRTMQAIARRVPRT